MFSTRVHKKPVVRRPSLSLVICIFVFCPSLSLLSLSFTHHHLSVRNCTGAESGQVLATMCLFLLLLLVVVVVLMLLLPFSVCVFRMARQAVKIFDRTELMRRGARFARPRARGPDGALLPLAAASDNYIKVSRHRRNITG